MVDFESSVKNAIFKYDMLDCTEKIVVGFSGGADSASLLYFLNNFIKKQGNKIKILAVHVNHCLRGEEAERDEQFAHDFCKNLGIDIIIKKIDVKTFAKSNKIGLEEAGRILRYKIFSEYAKDSKSKIAVAHTLSDCCETMILNLIRGTGLNGLCSIPPTRGNIIRPLIRTSRAAVEEYCKLNKISYIHDSTNFEKDYSRNKIRLDTIPYFKKINPNFENSVNRVLLTLEEDEAFLKALSDDILKKSCLDNYCYSIEVINSAPKPVKSRVIFSLLSKFSNKAVEYRHVELFEKLLIGECSAFMVSNNLRALRVDNNIIFENLKKVEKSYWSYPLKPGNNILDKIDTNIVIKVVPFSEYQSCKSKYDLNNTWAVNYDILEDECVFRPRLPGDEFVLPKRNISKSIKKYFNELKIPCEHRSKIPFLIYQGKVVWIDKIGVSKEYLPKDGIKDVMLIIVKKRGWC